ncbi:MAG: NAD(P)-dependent oxidoreductase [Phormidesmis sp.]
MTVQRIAVLGLGAMGARIAANLLDAGYPLTVWNRSTKPAEALALKGANVAATPKAAAEQADVVISMLTDNEASRAVWLAPKSGAIHGLGVNKIAVAMSTLTVDYVKELGTAIAHTGAAFLESPVVGSRPQADAQMLSCLVGGKADSVESVRPVLSATSGAIHHMGCSVGQAAAMKLAVNALFGIQVAALAELLAALGQHGISSAQAMDCLGEIPVMSPAARGAGAGMVNHSYAPQFPITLVEKDFRYACVLLKEGAMPMTLATQQIYRSAIAQGHGEKNITAIAQLFSQ